MPSFEFPVPKGLLRFYELFPDASIFNGQDFVCSEPCLLGSDWYGVALEPNLVQLAYENQVVWFLATKTTDGDDEIAYVINDDETVEHPSLNRYLAAFLINQTVRNKGLKLITEIDRSSGEWDKHGFLSFSEGWSKPGYLGYESFRISPDGQIIVGFHEDSWGSVVSNVELPEWLTVVAG